MKFIVDVTIKAKREALVTLEAESETACLSLLFAIIQLYTPLAPEKYRRKGRIDNMKPKKQYLYCEIDQVKIWLTKGAALQAGAKLGESV